MYYNEKLQFIRESKNITQKEISAYLNIKQQQYSRYEKGINLMPLTIFKKVCLYLNVSADSLLELPKDLEHYDL